MWLFYDEPTYRDANSYTDDYVGNLYQSFVHGSSSLTTSLWGAASRGVLQEAHVSCQPGISSLSKANDALQISENSFRQRSSPDNFDFEKQVALGLIVSGSKYDISSGGAPAVLNP